MATAHFIIIFKDTKKAWGILYPNGSIMVFTDFYQIAIPDRWFLDEDDMLKSLEADAYLKHFKEHHETGEITSEVYNWTDWVKLSVRSSERHYGDSEAIRKAKQLIPED